MKLRIRFIIFIFMSLIVFAIYSGMIMELASSVFSSFINQENEYKVVMYSLIFALISGVILISTFLIDPLFLIITLIKDLADDKYDFNIVEYKIYNSKGNIKARFFLYKEVIDNLYELLNKLIKVQDDRDKLERAKGEWVRGISHDLKTPLSYILGYSILLANRNYNWEEEEKIKFSNEIYLKCEYMKQLIDSLNNFVKITDTKNIMPLCTSEFDLVNYLKESIADILNIKGYSDYDINFKSNVKSLNVCFDKHLFSRVIKNLLTNTIIHNSDKVSVIVELIKEDDVYFYIEVTDSGKGLEPTETEFLCNNEYSLNSGKGLAVVKNIVLAHKGVISVESKENEGTKIRLSFKNI